VCSSDLEELRATGAFAMTALGIRNVRLGGKTGEELKAEGK
jgi:hypothetical protein